MARKLAELRAELTALAASSHTQSFDLQASSRSPAQNRAQEIDVATQKTA
jgi:hypothetical protein